MCVRDSGAGINLPREIKLIAGCIRWLQRETTKRYMKIITMQVQFANAMTSYMCHTWQISRDEIVHLTGDDDEPLM